MQVLIPDCRWAYTDHLRKKRLGQSTYALGSERKTYGSSTWARTRDLRINSTGDTGWRASVSGRFARRFGRSVRGQALDRTNSEPQWSVGEGGRRKAERPNEGRASTQNEIPSACLSVRLDIGCGEIQRDRADRREAPATRVALHVHPLTSAFAISLWLACDAQNQPLPTNRTASSPKSLAQESRPH